VAPDITTAVSSSIMAFLKSNWKYLLAAFLGGAVGYILGSRTETQAIALPITTMISAMIPMMMLMMFMKMMMDIMKSFTESVKGE